MAVIVGKSRRRPGWRRVSGSALLITALTVLAAFLWLNYAGFPGFLKERLLAPLRGEEFELGVARLRLEGLGAVIAEGVVFEPRVSNALPRLEIAEAQLLIDRAALSRLRFEARGLKIRDGRLEWRMERPGKPPELLLVTNVQSDLLVQPDQQWYLSELRGQTGGAKVTITARIKNPAAFRPVVRDEPSQVAPKWREQVGDLLELIRSLEFHSEPELALQVSGDASDWTTFRASARLNAERVESEWGTVNRLDFQSNITPTNQAFQNVTRFVVEGVDSDWLKLARAELNGRAVMDTLGERESGAEIDLRVEGLESPWVKLESGLATVHSAREHENAPYHTIFRASATPVEVASWLGTNLNLNAEVKHSPAIPALPRLLSRWLPGPLLPPAAAIATNELSGSWRLELDHIRAPRFAADFLHVFGTLARLETNSAVADSSLGFWNWITPYAVKWAASLSNIHTEEIQLGSAAAKGDWSAPLFGVQSMTASLYGGNFSGQGGLNIISREAFASGEADFDYHRAALLLDPPVRRWLARFTWREAPWVRASARFLVPEWTNSWNGFEGEVLRTLRLDGNFRGQGAFRGIPVRQAESSFRFRDFTWTLPDLVITRPEGSARLAYTGNVTNADFALELESAIDPRALKPLFPEGRHEVFEALEFPEPPIIRGVARGNWDADERLFADLQVAATNFVIKGEPYSDITARLSYTNLMIECENLLVHRGTEEIRAPYLRIDITNEVMFVTNAISTSDPYVAMKLIGEKVYQAIDPYRFATPPTVRINGIVPLRNHAKSDLHFEIAGHDFTFWKFHIPHLVGDVHWKGDFLSFSNVQASFYQGQARWSASFAFDEDNDAEFSFSGRAENADLKSLMADLFEGTNHMEGIFTGDLVITSARTTDDQSWNGFGSVRLRDGFLWNVPVFGVFSPIFESIAPGLGSSRITSGTANVTITNTVFHSEDMEVRSPAFRLRYDGHVDMAGNLEADVEAILLRDTWVLGPVFSVVLWPVSKAFEAEVTGTTEAPKTRLKYVPRVLLAPFRALNLLKPSPEREPAEREENAGRR